MNHETGRQLGEHRRDSALSLVREHKREQTAKVQLDFLIALRNSPTGEAAADDITTKLEKKYNGNAPYVGAAINGLAVARITYRVGQRKSARPSRKGNEIKVFRVLDKAKMNAKILTLEAELESIINQQKTDPVVSPAGSSCERTRTNETH